MSQNQSTCGDTPQPGAVLYDWQLQQWASLAPVVAGGRLPHAVLLSGAPGVGKRHLAGVLARALLCEQPTADTRPCGSCRCCRQMDAGSHPDFTELAPAEPGKAIRIDPARAFARALQLTGQYGHRRVGLIAPAEALNVAAANSLLKTMEEPPAGVHILLVSERPGLILPTIRSRCQHWRVARPRADALGAWLDTASAGTSAALPLARGAPLRALALAQSGFAEQQDTLFAALVGVLAAGRGDPLSLAGQWQASDPRLLLDWLYLLVTDLFKLAAGAPEALLLFKTRAPQLQAMAESLCMDRLRRFVPALVETRRLLETQVDTLLLLEALSLDLCRCRRQAVA
ncbi:MAG: DNA polymerase III subunit delta' [Salinisphaera sp.]|nr:DNA polymerase III subunit delta' [Salinisphaera sp.]